MLGKIWSAATLIATMGIAGPSAAQNEPIKPEERIIVQFGGTDIPRVVEGIKWLNIDRTWRNPGDDPDRLEAFMEWHGYKICRASLHLPSAGIPDGYTVSLALDDDHNLIYRHSPRAELFLNFFVVQYLRSDFFPNYLEGCMKPGLLWECRKQSGEITCKEGQEGAISRDEKIVTEP